MEPSDTATKHQWKFFRAGGFDQVLLETGDDLCSLAQLDKKLWSALSCPVTGVEFDQRTLQMLDSDNDGHIRVPEIIAAAEWAGSCLSDRQQLVNGSEGVRLAAISGETAEGAQVLDAARTLLANLGKADVELITVADTCDSETILAQTRFNGDGIITAASTGDEQLAAWVTDIISCLGSETDRSGEAGITGDLIEQFSTDSAAWLEWREQQPEGAAIPEPEEAMRLWHAVKAKVDDFFIRCRMAVYDSRAVTIFNSSDETLTALAPRNLSEMSDDIAALPLSAVTPSLSLNLEQGLNPAWQADIETLRRILIYPLLGDIAILSEGQWQELQSAVVRYETWWSARIESPVTVLGMERLNQWNNEETGTKLRALIDQDLALKPAFDAIVEVERLTRYCRDLLSLANNFVSFRDFYTGHGKAIFQAGSLFLDGRSFELCITVTDVAKHALLANLSRVYLVYCECIRNGGSDKMTIAAAITDGDSDQLLVGRNGIFYDRKGQDWDATIVRIIEHPISIRQAFWDPYKRIGKMVGEALQKIAAARSKATEEKAVAELIPAGTKKPDAKPAPPAFDVGKFAGIFAAVGLAIGAIGTAIASILTGFFKLPWWQMPLVIIAIMLLISGPSVFLAWFKLRQRNLGRLLDANGWAVNTRAKINIPFGASLTGIARLPFGAVTSLFDPFAEKQRPWKSWLCALLIACAIITAWWLGLLQIK